MASKRSWEWDWAGPHGTAWGTVNACLSTITATWLAHLLHVYWPTPTIVTVGIAAGGTVLGIISTLLRAAFGKPRQAATIVYKLACWVGAGGWAMVMLASGSWPGRWLAEHVAALVVMALVAGICAGLAADRPAPPAPVPVPTAAVSAPIAVDVAQRELDDLAAQWRARFDKFCPGPPGYEVPAIEHWSRGNGYTVQAVVPDGGGRDWRSIARHDDDFAADLDLPIGGKVETSMGLTRRVALTDVTTVDLLADVTSYPADRAPHSMRDALAVAHTDDGSMIGPNLRQYCMLLCGEARSGKTNAGKVLAAEVYTSTDGLLWEWDIGGSNLWSAEMEDWVNGVYPVPPVDWCAFDGRELLWQSRAALRVGHARKHGYRRAMIDADDDKVPVSDRLPAIVIIGDEIARVTGNMTEHDEAKENLRLVAFELGAAAVRAVFLALRGTDDVVSSSVQSQCQVRGVMKANSRAEVTWALGSGHDFGPEDTPYEGTGGLVLGSGEQVRRVKWFRMLPSTIRPVAALGATRRPALDDLSRMAANGRHPDGTPVAGLYDGELDCYDTRWDRFRSWTARGVAPVAPATPPAAVPSPAAAEASLNAAMAALDRRVAEVNAEGPDDDVELSDHEQREFDRLVEGFGSDWADDDQPETPPTPNDQAIMVTLIRAAGPRGIQPKDLLVKLAEAKIVVSRSTLHNYLNAALAANLVHQPSYGRWAVR